MEEGPLAVRERDSICLLTGRDCWRLVLFSLYGQDTVKPWYVVTEQTFCLT